MKFRRQVLTVPDGDPIVGAQVTLTRQDDSTVEATGTSDSEGWVEIATNGAPGNCWIQIDEGGSRRYDDSRSVRPYGAMNPGELVDLLNALLTDGTLPYGNRFQITRGTTSLTVGTGGAILNGVVGIWYSDTTITPGADGARMLVVQWSGTGRLRLLDVAYSASPTDQVVLATYTVTAGVISGLVWVGIPAASAIRGGYGAITGIARAASGGTGNAVGEDAGLSVTLTLRTGVEYTIYAEGSVIGSGNDGAIAVEVDGNLSSYQSGPGDVVSTISNSHARTKTGGSCVVRLYDRSDTLIAGWQLQATYGPIFDGLAMSSPSQVAVDGATILIADTGNDRVVEIVDTGVFITTNTGINGITGVCVDASHNYYVVYDGGSNIGVKKFNNLGVQQWSTTISGTSGAGGGHCTTDGTDLWITSPNDNRVYRRLCSSGGGSTNFGGSGSANGKFGTGGPYGIANDGTYLYVADPGNSRIQKFTLAGTYDAQWAVANTASGCAIDSAGRVIVAFPPATLGGGSGTVKRYTNTGSFVDQFTQSTPVGVGVASGDVLWVSGSTLNVIAKWDETSSSFSWQAGLLTAVAVPR